MTLVERSREWNGRLQRMEGTAAPREGEQRGQRLLLVEDEQNLARMLELELCYDGYQVEKAFDGRTGLEKALSGSYDLVLLDIMLPEMSGMEVLRRLRRSSQVPVIMLTARDTVVDKVSGLDSGADDYITKPFSIEELFARIRAALRKKAPAEERVLRAGPLTLCPQRREVQVETGDGLRQVDLTKREFDLLQYLLENKGHVVTRDVLLEQVWGFDYAGETNTVDVYVRFLRSKIDEVFHFKLIQTVRGVGYVIRESV